MTYVEDKLSLATKKWLLTEVEVIYKLDNRAVFSAISAIYGDVILKLNCDTKALSSEYHMIHTINGRGCCKAYDYDPMNGLLLEEKIIPGTVLRNEADVTIRIQRFAEVFHNIHYQVSDNHSYDTYLDWLDRACTKMHKIQNETNLDPKKLTTAEIELDQRIMNTTEIELDQKKLTTAEIDLAQMMLTAREIGYEMFDKYPDRVLLHGDLHHDNMLLTKSGDYAMIDPKGVVGPAIFDIPRFILNERDPNLNQTGLEHIQSVIRIISESLGYPIEDINQLFFMEVVLGNSWCVEDGEEPNVQDLMIASKILEN